jgi:hypothetical protein
MRPRRDPWDLGEDVAHVAVPDYRQTIHKEVRIKG